MFNFLEIADPPLLDVNNGCVILTKKNVCVASFDQQT